MAVLSGAPACALLPPRARRLQIDDPLDGVIADIARTSLPVHLSTWAQRKERELAPGDRIGGDEGTRFEIRELIGERLVVAHDDLLDRSVLLRFVSPSDAVEAARATAQLGHEGISRLLDLEHGDDRAFFVMEAIEGCSLASEIGGRLVAADRAVAIACEIADMVAHAHDNGVVHGDLDASCVVMTGDRRVALVGFGAASTEDGIRADVRAVGELLYAMLTDEPSPASVAVPHHLALRRPDLDAAAIELIARAIDGDIDAAELCDSLEAALLSLRNGQRSETASWTHDSARLSS